MVGSPGNISFRKIVVINKSSNTPVYLQIVQQLVNAIQRGYLQGNMQLPGTRTLSLLLKVHRKTIIAAFEELQAQGWITSVPNKGSYVNTKLQTYEQRRTTRFTQMIQFPATTGFHFKRSNILEPVDVEALQPLCFTDGQPDYRLSPTKELARYYSTILRRKVSSKHLGYGVAQGYSFFKTQLVNFLNQSRGLHINPQNILITRGMEMGMYVAANTLLTKGDMVLVADPGFYTANMIFQQVGATLKGLPVDKEGIDVEAVERICKKQKVRMLYITPHHHYPTTVTLSAQRRVALLQLSRHYGFIILEDDYEYDFYYDSRPLPPLAGANEHGMVVYLGSFGKTLPPGFRTGFLVAPENLIVEMQKTQSVIDRQGDSITELVLGEFIAEGEIHRHLKKAHKIYHERRQQFCNLLKDGLGDYIQFMPPPGGLAVWTEWEPGINLLRVSKACNEMGLLLPRYLLYQTKQISGMRLGFGTMDKNESEEAVQVLKKVLTK